MHGGLLALKRDKVYKASFRLQSAVRRLRKLRPNDADNLLRLAVQQFLVMLPDSSQRSDPPQMQEPLPPMSRWQWHVGGG